MGKTTRGAHHPPEPEPPAHLGWLPWITHHLAREWPVIKAAPLTMAFVFIVAALMAGTVVTLFYSEHIQTVEARDKYHADQVEDYRRAFPGKSPDEAVREVAALRSSLEETAKHLNTLEKAVSLAEEKNKTEIESMQKKIDKSKSFTPWSLTAKQKSELNKIIGDQPDKFAIQYQCLVGNSRSQSFAQDLVLVFLNHGWQMQGNCRQLYT